MTDVPRAYERYLVPAFFVPCAELLVRLATPVAGERAVDLACGTGVVARRLADRGLSVTGVDVSDAMVAFAAAAEPRVDWRVAAAGALPLGAGTAELVCCQQGLQFFPDPAGALRDVHRVLVPGGRLALAVWRGIEHHPAWATFVDAVDRWAGPEVGAVMRRPLSGPDRDGLRRLLTDAEFTGVRIRIATVLPRFPSAREFLRQEAAGSPLGALLDPAEVEGLGAELERDLAPYADDDGVVLPMQTWLVTAYR